MKSKNKFTRHLSDFFAPVVEKVYPFFNELVNGTPKMPSVFSFNGKINKYQCVETFMMIGFLSSPVYLMSNVLLHYVWSVLVFYLVAACIQKRCRDFGTKGKWWILVASLVIMIDRAFGFVDIYAIDSLWRIVVRANILVGLVMLVFLFTISSKPDTQKVADNIRSPLLKYPLLYVGVCWVLMIAGTLAVNHFFGISA